MDTYTPYLRYFKKCAGTVLDLRALPFWLTIATQYQRQGSTNIIIHCGSKFAANHMISRFANHMTRMIRTFSKNYISRFLKVYAKDQRVFYISMSNGLFCPLVVNSVQRMRRWFMNHNFLNQSYIGYLPAGSQNLLHDVNYKK